MDKLKQFIDSHKEEFDDITFPEGHFERFEQKLPHKGKRHTLLYSLCGVAAAACIAVLFFFSSPVNTLPEDDELYTDCEIEELHMFYTMQMNDIIARMEMISEKGDNPGVARLMQETKQVLEDSNEFEANIMPTLPCSDEGLFAMNQHYVNSIRSLAYMMESMERIIEIENID